MDPADHPPKLRCKHCGSGHIARSGFVRGLQRYKCKECGYNFTNTPKRGKSASVKALAILLYCACDLSQSAIAQLLDISKVSVHRWIRKELGGGRDVNTSRIDNAKVFDVGLDLPQLSDSLAGAVHSIAHFQGEVTPGLIVHILLSSRAQPDKPGNKA